MTRRKFASIAALSASSALAGPVGFRLPTSFSPASIPGLKLWLDASQIVGLNDGDAVSTWSDASGNGFDATQSVGVVKPVYKTGIRNGKPVVRFDGVDDYLLNASFAVNQPSTWFVVVTTTGGSPSFRFIVDAHDPGTAREALIYTVATTKWSTYANVFLDESGTTAGSTWKSVQAVFNGASSSIVVGGTTTAGNPGSSNLSGGYNIGTIAGTPAYFFGGDIAEMGCYDSVLSAGNLAALQTYLNAKYAL